MDLHAILPLLALASSIVSAVVAWGFATGRWTQRQEGDIRDLSRQLKEEIAARKEDHVDKREFKETVTVNHGRLAGRLDTLEQSLLFRAEKAENEHAVFFRRLDKLEDKTADLQRQIDRGSGV